MIVTSGRRRWHAHALPSPAVAAGPGSPIAARRSATASALEEALAILDSLCRPDAGQIRAKLDGLDADPAV
jgi:hypothetical protein